jgi:hypothetical protein
MREEPVVADSAGHTMIELEAVRAAELHKKRYPEADEEDEEPAEG